MKENTLRIIIDRPLEDIFEYTTNPQNTHRWIPSIVEEIAEQFPPIVGTEYKNRDENSHWNLYKVTKYEPNTVFELSDMDKNYHVIYTYKKISDNQTEMEYYEWMESGNLENPFTEDVLENLKSMIEKQ